MWVEIYDDGVYIFDADGKEIVGWVEDEWLEDPKTVVPAMLTAIDLVLNAPHLLIETLKEGHK